MNKEREREAVPCRDVDCVKWINYASASAAGANKPRTVFSSFDQKNKQKFASKWSFTNITELARWLRLKRSTHSQTQAKKYGQKFAVITNFVFADL